MSKTVKLFFMVTILTSFSVSFVYPEKSKVPPKIPHAQDDKYTNCLECHEKGKEVDGKKAPVTRHPAMKKCSSCHKPLKN
ncbi:MAG: hypothetical protein OEV78_04530 [Spirochaetia bacterium]|nr:hypothetical protein [Spirochaetia bacterium]